MPNNPTPNPNSWAVLDPMLFEVDVPLPIQPTSQQQSAPIQEIVIGQWNLPALNTFNHGVFADGDLWVHQGVVYRVYTDHMGTLAWTTHAMNSPLPNSTTASFYASKLGLGKTKKEPEPPMDIAKTTLHDVFKYKSTPEAIHSEEALTLLKTFRKRLGLLAEPKK